MYVCVWCMAPPLCVPLDLPRTPGLHPDPPPLSPPRTQPASEPRSPAAPHLRTNQTLSGFTCRRFCHLLAKVLMSTWSKSLRPLGMQGFGPEGGTRFQFGLGELGQVRHHRVLVHIGVHNLLWGDHLQWEKELEADLMIV